MVSIPLLVDYYPQGIDTSTGGLLALHGIDTSTGGLLIPMLSIPLLVDY